MGTERLIFCERIGGREIIGSQTTVNEVVVSRLILGLRFAEVFCGSGRSTRWVITPMRQFILV